MRLSTRLLANAAANYTRMAVTFGFGVFFVWYAVGKVGLAGLGMIGLTGAAVGASGSIELAMRGSLVREMAAAVASGQPDRVRRSLASAALLCLLAAGLVVAATGALAAVAYLGLFRTPEGVEGMRLALAVLVLAEGAQVVARLLAGPYTQALFASQHVVLDNVLIALARVANAAAAVIAFGWLYPGAALADQLIAFGVTRSVLQVLIMGLGVVLAKVRVKGLALDPRAFDRAEFRSIVSTVWHTSQVLLLMNLNVQFLAILINWFFGMTYNGVWLVVVQIGGYARMVAEGLLRGVDPLSTHLLEQGRMKAIVDIMMRTIRYQLGVLVPLAAWLTIFMHPLLDLWVAGRMARDPILGAAGITVSGAVSMIAVMSYFLLAAQVVRGSAFGVERMLYGAGEVRSYSWFAKYAALGTVGLSALLMWLFDSPVMAPATVLLFYVAFYYGVVLPAGVRRLGLPLGETLRRAIPRPLAATAILCVPLLLVRLRLGHLTPVSLVVLAAGSALGYGLLMYLIVFESDEGRRITQLLMLRRTQRGMAATEDGRVHRRDAESAEQATRLGDASRKPE